MTHLKNLSTLINKTPIEFNKRLSIKFNNNIFFKREDLQISRSFKIRGVMNKIINNIDYYHKYGVICASTGNHAQGVAYACNKFGINGVIVISNNTTRQKIDKIKYLGGGNIKIIKYGMLFNNALNKAISISSKTNMGFIHPYDDIDIINGQSSIGYEIHDQINADIIISSIGGGGLISGVYKSTKPKHKCKIIGVEPYGACSMKYAFKYGYPYEIEYIDRFVDGAAVSRVGSIPFEILYKNIDIHLAKNREISQEIVDLYNYEGIIIEPAGVMPLVALNKLDKQTTGKNIVCILSGGNSDITRIPQYLDLLANLD